MASSGQCEVGMSYVGDRVYGKVRGDTWAGRQDVSPGLVGPLLFQIWEAAFPT